MLKTRVLSALVFVPVILVCLFLGGIPLAIMIAGIAFLGTYEYARFLEKMSFKVLPFLVFISVLVILLNSIYGQNFVMIGDGVVYIIILLHVMFFLMGKLDFRDIVFSFFGIFYVSWTLGHVLLIREVLENGLLIILLVFFIEWATDVGAYFAGRFFGKHKLAPLLSPNKTIEGALGGLICAMVVSIAFNYYFPILEMPLLIIMAAIASILGQMGDLMESGIKRWVSVKDSGTVIPGHGGMLDRFDSLILIAPFVYYYVQIVMAYM